MRNIQAATRQDDLVTLFVCHDLNLALDWADRVVVMAAGRVVASGPPVEVMTPGLLRDIYNVQARIERCSAGRALLIYDHAL